MIRALAHPVRARVLARGRERDTRARVVVLARASDANDDDDDDEALEREFARIRAKTEKAKKIPLSPRERLKELQEQNRLVRRVFFCLYRHHQQKIAQQQRAARAYHHHEGAAQGDRPGDV